MTKNRKAALAVGLGLGMAGVFSLVGFDAGQHFGRVLVLVMLSGAMAALLLSVSNRRGVAMAGGGAEDESQGSGPLHSRIDRMSDADKDEIAQLVFDRLFVWAGRSIAKRLWLGVLAVALAVVGWVVKDHITLK